MLCYAATVSGFPTTGEMGAPRLKAANVKHGQKVEQRN